MKVRTAACLCVAWAACLACAAEQDVLIPYELDGYIGFVNQDLEKITEAEYKHDGSDDSCHLQCVSAYCALFSARNDKTGRWEFIVVTNSGIEIVLPRHGFSDADCIGDEYFAIVEEDGSRFKTTIASVFGGEVYVLYDWIVSRSRSLEYIEAYQVDLPISRYNYVNYKGELKFPADNEWKRIFDFNEEAERGIVLDAEFTPVIIDKNGDTVKKFEWLGRRIGGGLVSGIEDGARILYAQEKPVGGSEELRRVQEGAFYNQDGKAVFPAVFDFYLGIVPIMTGLPAFNSGVLPCRIIDGVIYVSEMEYDAKESSDWAIIDTEGNPIASGITAKWIAEFSGGVARIVTLNGAGEEEVRLIDTRGEILTAEAFDEIAECINGYCMAKKDGEDYLISAADGTAYRCRDFDEFASD